MSQRFQALQELGEQFERAAAKGAPVSRIRMRGRGLWALAGTAGAAVMAGAVTAIILVSGGTTPAYAGWTPVPKLATRSELATAVRNCYGGGGVQGGLDLRVATGSRAPVLAEARGASAAAIYVVDSTVYMCLYDAALPYVDNDSLGPLRLDPGPDQLSIPYGVWGGSGHGVISKSGAAARHRGGSTRAGGQLPVRARTVGAEFGYWALGQAGSDVSAVTFTFAGGKTVDASVQNGWYFAWWPWTTDPSSVTVTTSTGVVTSPMKNTWPGGYGSRPYPACQAGSAGCVFDTKQPAAPTTPSTNVLAGAAQTCTEFALGYGVAPPDAFAGRPLISETHASFAALFNVVRGKVYGCIVGGHQQNVHDFFMQNLAAFGRVHVTPGPDQITDPYAEHNGVGSGRPIGFRRLTRNAPQAQAQARSAILQGGGYGPYALGQAGSAVSSISFAFANGKSVAATIRHGWYFAWWPWVSAPTTVTVRTRTGTVTSPLASPGSGNVSIDPGCRPGTGGCVFVRNPPAPSRR
ncbi:MAG TPA: hypothetical protein VME01_06100 [Solirubrobacteraceae bacterium]|nr:hypothetical protein [Solirubrobacteraceae bacterium]